MPHPELQLSQPFRLVTIACPASAVQSLETFVSNLEPTFGAAVVIVVDSGPSSAVVPHADVDVAHRISPITAMPVTTVLAAMPLRPGHVFVIPPGRRVSLAKGLISSDPIASSLTRDVVDGLMSTVAGEGYDTLAVLLNGATEGGSTAGLKALKQSGGIVLVEQPVDGDHDHDTLSRIAIAGDLADIVLEAAPLAARLGDLLRGYDRVSQSSQDGAETLLRSILSYVRARTGQDFQHYKRSTVSRRLMRRMQLKGCEDLAAYLALLRESPDEVQALFSDLLISVTAFFRDTEAFDALQRLVVPSLVVDDATEPVRVWVPGCATGEEAYSIAILLLEEAARREVRPEIQIFATDLDPSVLAVAREGCYPLSIASEVAEQRLQRYFTREGSQYRIRKEVRDLIVFANHSLLKDPPFSRLDLVSCRNLLIYLERELQPQVCSALHYALRSGRYLFLGPAETAEGSGLFRAVDRENRIYQAVENLDRRVTGLPVHLLSPQPIPPAARPPARGPVPGDAALHLGALEELAPPSILVDHDHRIVHLSESAGRFLQPSGGAFSTSISQMARPELRLDIRTGLHRAFERGEKSFSLPVAVEIDGAVHRIFVQVSPANRSAESRQLALVVFIDAGPMPNAQEQETTAAGTAADHLIRQLQEEIQLTRERLKVSREEYEATNEELRAANEELQSVNEEYRSTAEELETSKEELQSMNEELQTLNSELKTKLEGVSRAHSDLQNLMSATEVGTLFLDPILRIKLFTPRLADLFNITPGDQGRPITDLTHRLNYDALDRDAIGVLKDLTPKEREVQSRSGRWFLMRLRPYRTVDDRIDGVVVTFVDITERRETERQLRQLTSELDHRVKNLLARISVLVEKSRHSVSSAEELATSLKQRVRSMANAHALLSLTQWSSASLQQIFTTEVKLYAESEMFRYIGPDVSLKPDPAQAIALVIHELSTNAAKFGAFSVTGGRVTLSVEIDSETRPGVLRMVWKETGCKAVHEPKRKSYGMHVIDNLLVYEASAATETVFDQDGLRCEIAMPLDAVEAQNAGTDAGSGSA